jgi:hypothetical protein
MWAHVPSPLIETIAQPSLVMLSLTPVALRITLNQESRLKFDCRALQALKQKPHLLDSKAANFRKRTGQTGGNGPALNRPLTKLVQSSSMDSIWSAI